MRTSRISTNKPVLRRYSDLPALLGILINREITLLPPSSWDDRNDRYLMETYKNAKNLKTLLALCFSLVSETYHHWRVFAPGNSGVIIEFDRAALLKSLPEAEITHSAVEYKAIENLKSPELDIDRLPFMKMPAFSDEKEYRIVFSSTREDVPTKGIPIDLSTIINIGINPWLTPSLFKSIHGAILSIDGCDGIHIYRSTLLESTLLKGLADKHTQYAD